MNKRNGGRKIFIVISLLMTFIVLSALMAYIVFVITNRSIIPGGVADRDEIIHIRDNVLVKSSDGSEMVVNLPKKFADNNVYSYNFKPQRVNSEKKLFMYIKGAYQTISLTYRDEVIYEKGEVDSDYIKSGGDYIRLVMIPDQYIGKELTLSFKALNTSSYGILIQDIMLGSHSDLMMYCYSKQSDVLLIAAFLLVFSIESFIALVVLGFYRKIHIRSFLVSLYALVLGFYIILRTPALFFLIPRGTFVYVMDYLFFMILPFTVALFIISVAKKRGSNKLRLKIIEFILAILLLGLIVQTVLMFFGYIEFVELQKLSQISVVSVALLSIIIPYAIDDFEYKMTLSTAMAVLMVVLVVLLGVYLTTYRIRYMTILGAVGGLFIVFQSLVVMKMYSKTYAVSYKARLNKRLAFTDNLTRILNRNAFENDMREIVANGKKMMLMIIDINNLKQINDKYGHSSGDYIIKSVAEMLYRLKINYKKTTPYRIGGDEFVVTAFDVDDSYAQRVMKYLNAQAAEFRQNEYNIPLDFGVACEVTEIDENFRVDEFIQEVDKEMYEDKKIKKQLI